ncbi:hypothetical protein B0H10DRAFT_1956981 [Mycena sp. CBHHK59/15]|nr:hypothetical protein B0H10DRAFT_1956981 [Mycena sp. CBHHK59/15]
MSFIWQSSLSDGRNGCNGRDPAVGPSWLNPRQTGDPSRDCREATVEVPAPNGGQAIEDRVGVGDPGTAAGRAARTREHTGRWGWTGSREGSTKTRQRLILQRVTGVDIGSCSSAGMPSVAISHATEISAGLWFLVPPPNSKISTPVKEKIRAGSLMHRILAHTGEREGPASFISLAGSGVPREREQPSHEGSSPVTGTTWTPFGLPPDNLLFFTGRIIMEANGLFWATSIMPFMFIQHFIDNAMHAPPSVIHEDPGGWTSDQQIECLPTYLIEEFIDGADGFYKFINNGGVVPLPLPKDETVRTVAEFLPFTQHVEFYKTKGMVYLSHLQGKFSIALTLISTHLIARSTKLLTDPQIMTALEGVEIFGEWNVPAAFNFLNSIIATGSVAGLNSHAEPGWGHADLIKYMPFMVFDCCSREAATLLLFDQNVQIVEKPCVLDVSKSWRDPSNHFNGYNISSVDEFRLENLDFTINWCRWFMDN